MGHRVRKAPVGLLLAAAFAGAPVPAGAQETSVGESLAVRGGEVREGDLYAADAEVRILGRLAGDLVAVGDMVLVDGQVDGDMFALGWTIDLLGPIGDSTRVVGDQVIANTTIDGDLLAAAYRLLILESAVIRGGVAAAAGTLEIEGTIEKDLRAVAGEIVLRGAVLGDANVTADRIDIAPGSRIDGDLDYRTRVPLTPEAAARVAGSVRYKEPSAEDDDGVVGSLIFWGWQTGAALLAGMLAVALSRRVVQNLVSAITRETTLGGLLGFGAFLIVPVGAVVVMMTVVGLPIGTIAVLLFGAALYLAKLPIAVWAGEQLLARAGCRDASPYAAMAVGILALYLLFEIPWLGGLFWLAATWLGLGAMVLSGHRYLSAKAG